jgi:hypothetical protein
LILWLKSLDGVRLEAVDEPVGKEVPHV